MIFDPLAPFPGYRGYAGNNPAIPNLYWNNHGNEERIARICRALHNVECYATDLGVQVNLDIAKINELGNTLEQLQNGGWFDEYAEQLEAWIRDITNLEQIAQDVLDDSGIPAAVTALEAAVSGEGGLESRMTAAEGDIDALEGRADALENTISGTGGLESRMTTAEADIDALEGRIDDAEADTDALESRLSLEALRDSIPDTLHEATPLVRIPVDFVSSTVQTHPQGFALFGGTPETPVYAAVYQYHRVDTVNGADTVGDLEVWRLEDGTRVNRYSFNFGHGNSISTDWTGKRLFVCEHSRSGVASNRVFVLTWTESGTLQLYETFALPFVRVQGFGMLSDGRYWLWSPDAPGTVQVSDTISTDGADWSVLINFTSSALGTGLTQQFGYAAELDSFTYAYANGSGVAFIDALTGDVWRFMQIDAALGFIALEELEAVQIVGTRAWLCNSPVYDSNHNGVLNIGAEATIWTVNLPASRNYKELASSRVTPRWTYHIGTEYAGLPTKDWTTPGAFGGRIDLNNPRDLISLGKYPGETIVYIDTPYPTRVFPFIDTGFVILSGPSNANLVNGNQCETIGGLYMYGPRTYVTWFGWNTGTGIQITPEAVANWPQVYSNRPTWIRMTYFPTLNMRGATATKTATDNSVWIGGEDGALEWPSVSSKTVYMYMLRAILRDTVTAQ